MRGCACEDRLLWNVVSICKKTQQELLHSHRVLNFLYAIFISGFNIYLLEKRHMCWVVSLYYRSMMCPYLTVFLNKFQVKRAKKKATYETVSGRGVIYIFGVAFHLHIHDTARSANRRNF